MLVGLTKSIDPFYEKGRSKVSSVAKQLQVYKKGLKSEADRKRLFYECGGYHAEALVDRGENGSYLSLDIHSKIDSVIRKELLPLLEDVRHRSRAYTTHISRYRDICFHLATQNKKLFTKIKLSSKESAIKKAGKLDKELNHNDLSYASAGLAKGGERRGTGANISFSIHDEIECVVEDQPKEKFKFMVD